MGRPQSGSRSLLRPAPNSTCFRSNTSEMRSKQTTRGRTRLCVIALVGPQGLTPARQGVSLELSQTPLSDLPLFLTVWAIPPTHPGAEMTLPCQPSFDQCPARTLRAYRNAKGLSILFGLRFQRRLSPLSGSVAFRKRVGFGVVWPFCLLTGTAVLGESQRVLGRSGGPWRR